MRTVALLLAVAAACACRAPGAGSTSSVVTDAGARLEQPYPIEPFDTAGLDGHPISLASWKGRVVVINVWATWCAPCRREMPALSALQDKYRDQVRVLGLLQDNVTDAFALQFLAAADVRYPVARSTFDLERRFPPVLALPTTFVIDPAGRLVAMYAGEIDPAALERALRPLLGGTGPAD